MTAALYAKGREGFLAGDIDWDTHVIKVVGIDTGAYTVNLATHANLSDIAVGARIFTSPALTGKTVTDGVANADPVTILAVTGVSVEAIAWFKDTGSAATSRLIGYSDAGVGLPIIPTGDDVILTWDTGANRIFRL